jgi:Pin2-interacting protein X1
MAEDNTASRSSFLDLAGSKLRARLSSQVNESASEGVTSKFARRHLEKLGWEEGTGLGKRRSGITTHIKVQRRKDEQGGIGKSSVDENLQIGNEWWKSSTGNVLAKLGGKKKKKKGSKEKKKIFTDEELFEATGGARFGMRQGVRQEGKWNRTEKSAILKQQEEEAKQKVEWDGMTAPKVILSADLDKKAKKKKKREREEEKVVETVEKETKEERRARKKRKKEEKKKKLSS